jgi:hypothetical protein
MVSATAAVVLNTSAVADPLEEGSNSCRITAIRKEPEVEQEQRRVTRNPPPDSASTGTEAYTAVAMLAMLLRHRWLVLRWALAGALVALALALARGTTWTVTTSFVLRGNEGVQSSLRGLAGQFGLTLPGTAQGPTPRFYVELLHTHAILAPIAQDTFTIRERTGGPAEFADLLNIKARSLPERIDEGVRALATDIITTRIDKESGLVTLSVRTHSPDLSLAVAGRLLAALNRFSLLSSQVQASEERRFTEGRLEAARAALAAAEDRLLRFLQSNRQFESSSAAIPA